METFLFGAVYIIEQDYTDEEIVRDLQNMKECGYNLITLWPIGNAWLAKSSHEWIFIQTRKVLDICDTMGMKAILQLFGQNQAQEFMPDSALTKEMEDEDQFGAFININSIWSNLNNPTVREYFDLYFREAITTLKDHPAVYGWDVYNEAHFRSDDPFTTRYYQEWLENKYQDIRQLNRDWYRRFESFSQIRPDKRRASYSIWSSLLPAVEYEKFRSENLTDICRFLYQTAKKYDDQHPIIIDGTSAWILQEEITMRNNDEFETAYVPDIYGATFYPKSWGRNYRDTPWTLSMYYSIPASAARKAGKPYFVNELQTHTQSVLTPGSEVSTKELQDWIMMCIFTGSDAMQLWRWRPFLHGYQSTGRGMTRMDGTPNKRSRITKEVLAVINANMDLFGNFKVSEPTVRIAYSYRSRLFFDSLLKWEGSFWSRDIEGWYKLFWNHGMPAEMANLEKLDEMDYKTPVLVLPSIVSISGDEALRLTEYVKQGGLLIGDCRMASLDEKGVVPSEGIPGKILTELFGFKEVDVASGEYFVVEGQQIPAAHMSQQLELVDSGEAVAFMEDGTPAVVYHKKGKGATLYFNSFMGIGLLDQLYPQVDAIVLEAMKDIPTIRAQKDERVHLAFIESETKKAMLAINFTNQVQIVKLTGLKADIVMKELFGEQEIVSEETTKITLAPDQCAVYQWERSYEIYN